MANVEIAGLDRLLRRLATQLAPVVQAASVAVAAEVVDRISPYPDPVPERDGRWYERGYGARYRRKDGSVGGRKSSQMLGRRWSIEPTGDGAIARNSAGYSRRVHARQAQAGVHRNRWRTDGEVIAQLVNDGTVQSIVSAAVRQALEKAG